MKWLMWSIALCTVTSCGEPAPAEDTATPPRCLWNQAYQENTSVDAVDAILAGAQGCYVLIDPFESSEAAQAISAMQAAENTVGCYISAGTCEDWRSDYAETSSHCTTTEWPEWPGEFFVTDPDGMLAPMKARIDQLATWGCDMVELDNMDWASDPEQNEEYGLGVTPDEAASYYGALCDYIHDAGMLCMAKSTRADGEAFDGGTFESFSDNRDWWEHEHLQSFLDQGRLGVIFHYGEADCDEAEAWYRARYGDGLSFLCEDPSVGGYLH